MKRDFLLEVGCENLPSGYLDGALDQLEKAFTEGLGSARIGHEGLEVFGTPNRLVVYVRQIDQRQDSTEETVSGPPVSVAIDADGRFTKAAEGFARREGVEPGELKRIKTDRGEYLAVVRKIRGEAAEDVLTARVPGWIEGIRFPKTMKWEASGFRFARPVRWVLAFFGRKVLRFEVGPLSSSGSTRLSPYFGEETGVGGIEEYFDTMKSAGIVLDHRERRKRVSALAGKAAAGTGGRLVEDEGLCRMVANLVESPVVMSGTFDTEFLTLPREVIVTALKSHQRYFSVEDENGRLLPSFIAFADGARRNRKEITRGYERVLQARLADAAFYFAEDTAEPIEAMAGKLRDIVWLEGLGTLEQKSERIAALSLWIAEDSGIGGGNLPGDIARAARLAKADIASEMVKDGKEFTLLQGYIGREYSRLSGEKDEVSEAIYEHYFPRYSGDRLPGGDAGTVLSIADRIDTMVGCFIQGLGPTGSQDPYALRRHAIAVLRILTEKRMPLDLRSALSRSLDLFRDESLAGAGDDPRDAAAQAFELVNQRFYHMLRGEGFDHDLVSAVTSSPWEVPCTARDTVAALQGRREDGSLSSFVLAMKRISNIIPAGMRGNATLGERLSALASLASCEVKDLGFSEDLFREDAEKRFFSSAVETAGMLQGLITAGSDPAGALSALESLVPEIDRFFDEVLINCEDLEVRQNRLAFLRSLELAFGILCVWSEISGEQ